MQAIKKIQVLNGVYWVEIPEAGLNILCGCPADCVKHLMKRGLILQTEKDGAQCETGPNAILLSDVTIQSGDFSNMAEFPILQMLYRQGMIIPNHPNNTGQKPILMGLKEQVQSQLQYIYRGNYGLTSEEEIMEAGVSREQARELMNMKLKFAFGKLHKTEDFLETRIIKNDPVEICNGVSIQRLSVNVFEISYKSHSVSVDLNLKPFEKYDFPYTLSHHYTYRGYFSVIHLGEGDGWDPHRPSMGSILMFHGKIYLIDAGPNIINSLMALGIGVNEIEGIFQTHCHDDHFAGLPSLIRADRKLKYYATPLVRLSVAKKLSALLSINEDSFPTYFDVQDLELDVWNKIIGLEVKPVLSPHPVETTVLLFRTLWRDGFRSYAHFADIVSLDILKKMIRSGDAEPGVSQSFFDKVKSDYLVKANLKKLDVGGGMIHGNADDFKKDPSDRIVLSHTSIPITERQKEIGSGSPFGAEDILIPANKDYVWQCSYKFLRTYFPTVPDHQLQILLNNQVVKFNPQTIILKEGVANEEMYLIISGLVESIQPNKGRSLLYPGTLVGETSGIFKMASQQTYVTISFVKALVLPSWLYTEVVKMNGLYVNIERFQTLRGILAKTWLFGEGISYPVQNEISKAAKIHHFEDGETLDKLNPESIYLIRKGQVKRLKDKVVFETLEAGDFFGEESAIFKAPSLFHTYAEMLTAVYEIPGKLLEDIPIIRWKLFETYEKRKKLILNMGLSSKSYFKWREWYNIGIPEMDSQHKKLIETVGSFLDALKEQHSKQALDKALQTIVDLSIQHFESEQKFLQEHEFAEYQAHCALHKNLIDQILELKCEFEKTDYTVDLDVVDFFTKWLINHILIEDKKYSPVINSEAFYNPSFPV